VIDTGLPQQDAEADSARQRRSRALARIVARLRSEPDDVSHMLPFEEVVAALGRRGEVDLGLVSTDAVIERLLGEVRPPAAGDDTMVRRILTELS
jgi:hypothetical protein